MVALVRDGTQKPLLPKKALIWVNPMGCARIRSALQSHCHVAPAAGAAFSDERVRLVSERVPSDTAMTKFSFGEAPSRKGPRERFALLGRDVSQLSDDQLRNLVSDLERRFRDEGLTSAAQAATIILDGVKANRWRILVGVDAQKIDEMVRQIAGPRLRHRVLRRIRPRGGVDRAPLSRERCFAPAELITGLSPSAARGYACQRCGDLKRAWFDRQPLPPGTTGGCLTGPAVPVGPDNDWNGWKPVVCS